MTLDAIHGFIESDLRLANLADAVPAIFKIHGFGSAPSSLQSILLYGGDPHYIYNGRDENL
ncbi:MAG: hypothetical protein ACLTFJ_12065 [Clostridium sp.]